MNYLSLAEAAVQFHIPVKELHRLCERGGICGAVRFGRIWALPETVRPEELADTREAG